MIGAGIGETISIKGYDLSNDGSGVVTYYAQKNANPLSCILYVDKEIDFCCGRRKIKINKSVTDFLVNEGKRIEDVQDWAITYKSEDGTHKMKYLVIDKKPIRVGTATRSHVRKVFEKTPISDKILDYFVDTYNDTLEIPDINLNKILDF